VTSIATARALGSASDVSPDDLLVARCRAGSEEAFEALVGRHADIVYRTLYLMARDPLLAEDLTQETFLHAWRGLAGFRSGGALRPWLLRIAVNRLISHRRRKLLRIVPLAWTDRQTPSAEAAPETLAEASEASDMLRDAIARLPENQRYALVLRYYADLSILEIATVTGWRQGTVKSRLHRALEKMRILLAPSLAEELGHG
jgi:RNA polymerase sigma-70 factor (ECF subfamily)